MKKPIILVIMMTVITALIGLGLSASGYPPPREELSGWKATAYAVITWPLFFAIFGVMFAAPVLYFKRNQSGAMQTKSGRIALIAALSNPAIMLVIQILYPLKAMKLISDPIGDLALLVICTFMWVLIGNYAAIQPPGSPSGLRNRWTLGDDRVWTKTHRFLGRSIVVTALIVSPLAAVIDLDNALIAVIATMLSIVVMAAIYSRYLSSPNSGLSGNNTA